MKLQSKFESLSNFSGEGYLSENSIDGIKTSDMIKRYSIGIPGGQNEILKVLNQRFNDFVLPSSARTVYSWFINKSILPHYVPNNIHTFVSKFERKNDLFQKMSFRDFNPEYHNYLQNLNLIAPSFGAIKRRTFDSSIMNPQDSSLSVIEGLYATVWMNIFNDPEGEKVDLIPQFAVIREAAIRYMLNLPYEDLEALRKFRPWEDNGYLYNKYLRASTLDFDNIINDIELPESMLKLDYDDPRLFDFIEHQSLTLAEKQVTRLPIIGEIIYNFPHFHDLEQINKYGVYCICDIDNKSIIEGATAHLGLPYNYSTFDTKENCIKYLPSDHFTEETLVKRKEECNWRNFVARSLDNRNPNRKFTVSAFDRISKKRVKTVLAEPKEFRRKK